MSYVLPEVESNVVSTLENEQPAPPLDTMQGIRTENVVFYLRSIANALSSIVVDITAQLNQIEQSRNPKETNV